MKTCTKCGISKPLSEYSFITKASGKYKAECKVCNRIRVRKWASQNPDKCRSIKSQDPEYRKQWRKANPDKTYKINRRKQLKKLGLTFESLEEMLKKQNNRCAICNFEFGNDGRNRMTRPNVDHCHKTGITRGLLCTTCNTTLGKIKDDTILLRKMISYLLK